jgi:hypothetical protein
MHLKKINHLFIGIVLISFFSCSQSENKKEKEKRTEDSTQAIEKLKIESDSLDKLQNVNKAKDFPSEYETNKKAKVKQNAK